MSIRASFPRPLVRTVREGRMPPFGLADKAIDAAIDGNADLAHRLLDEAIEAFEPVRRDIEKLERERNGK